eukprot:214383-Pyramimonas_sp.AAC.1
MASGGAQRGGGPQRCAGQDGGHGGGSEQRAGAAHEAGVMIVSRPRAPRSVRCDDSVTPAGPSERAV